MAKLPPSSSSSSSSASKAVSNCRTDLKSPSTSVATSHPSEHKPFDAAVSQLSGSPTISLTDITCALFVLLNLPPYLSLLILVAHSISSSSRLASSFSPGPSSFLVALSLVALYLISRNHKHDYLFRHILNAANAVFVVHLLGPVSVRIVSSLANRKLSTRIVYNRSESALSTKFIACIVSLVCINYALWLLRWICPNCDAPIYARPFNIDGVDRSLNSTSVYAHFFKSMLHFSGHTQPLSILDLAFVSRFATRMYLWIALHTIISWIIMNPLTKPSLPETSWPESPRSETDLFLHVYEVDMSHADSKPKRATSVQRHNFAAFVKLPLNAKLAAIRLRLRALSIQLLSQQINIMEEDYSISPQKNASDMGDLERDIARSKKLTKTDATRPRLPASDIPRSTATTTASCNARTFSSLTTTTSCPHCATIESIVSVQPLWLYFAACKAFLFKKSAFGSEPETSSADVSIVRVDSSTIICRIPKLNEGAVTVQVNGFDWPQVVCEQQGDVKILLIVGLTPRLHYQVGVFVDCNRIGEFSANTASFDNVHTNDEVSSLRSLQNSVIAAASEYQALCASSKQRKRDDNKRIASLKHQLESLNTKMERYNAKPSNDVRKFGKLQGLKHAIAQLDGEIAQLETESENLKQRQSQADRESARDERSLVEQIDACRLEIAQYNERMAHDTQDLRNHKQEAQALAQKHGKLELKVQARSEEVRVLQQELKAIKKNVVQARFSKRTRKATENMETVLPLVERDIQRLHQECADLLST